MGIALLIFRENYTFHIFLYLLFQKCQKFPSQNFIKNEPMLLKVILEKIFTNTNTNEQLIWIFWICKMILILCSGSLSYANLKLQMNSKWDRSPVPSVLYKHLPTLHKLPVIFIKTNLICFAHKNLMLLALIELNPNSLQGNIKYLQFDFHFLTLLMSLSVHLVHRLCSSHKKF